MVIKGGKFMPAYLSSSSDDKTSIQSELGKKPLNYKIDIITIDDMFSEIKKSIPFSA